MDIFNKRYIVTPVERATAQDRHIQELVTKVGNVVKNKTLLKKTKAVMPSGTSSVDILKFKRSQDNKNMIDTGLDELIINPFYIGAEEDVDVFVNNIINKYGLGSSWDTHLRKIMKMRKIPLQTMAEIQFGLEPDTLTSRIPKSNSKEDQTKISKFTVVLYDRANIFNTNDLNGFLAVQLLKRRTDKVHYPPNPLNSAVHNWTMIEQAKMYQNDISINIKQNETIARYVNFVKRYPNIGTLSANPLYWLGVILRDPRTNKSVIKGNAAISTAAIDSKLNDFIKEGDDTLEQRLDSFNELMDLFEENSIRFMVKYCVYQARLKGIVVIRDGFVFWLSQLHNPGLYKFSSLDALELKLYQELMTGSKYFLEFLHELDEAKAPIPDELREKAKEAYELATKEEEKKESTVPKRRGRPKKSST